MEIKNLKKSYGKKNVLCDVNFQAKKGQCVGIIGGNGSGKSTLFNILAGVLKADEGEFLWNGSDLLKQRKLRVKKVGYVPQSTPLFEEISALDNLKLWYNRTSLKKELDSGVLAMLGIPGFLNVSVKKMSGGMKKRLSVGCAVAHKPQILLLDEPGAALDLVCREYISNYVEELKKENKTVIIATHDIQDFYLCDKMYILKNGILSPYVFDGNVHRLAGKL